MAPKPRPEGQRITFDPTTWATDEVFIIGGGTSVRPEVVSALEGRARTRTIVVNSSYRIAPWADTLFFADERWINEELAKRPDLIRSFATTREAIGIISRPDLPWLRSAHRLSRPGLSVHPDKIQMQYSSATGAINIALLRGAKRLVLVGMDNRDGDEVDAKGYARVHYHEEYKWPRHAKGWEMKQKEAAAMLPGIAHFGAEVINASLISTFPWWPKVDLADWLKENPPC